MEIKFPEKLLFLINEPAPVKILYGGRGAGKTENIAVALIILASQKKLRVACFREFQKSINESVHATIKNQIHDLGLDDEFDISDKSITSKRTGSEFIFAGLRYNINNIKSMARIDIAWVEEAVNVSKTSWDKLEPTIRGRHKDDPNGMGGPFGKGPELWISFNPELDTDETYKRFILERNDFAPDFAPNEDTGEPERYAFCLKLNWSDNPFFPSDLKRKMNILKKADETAWLNVWEGHTKQTLDGAIYADEIKKVLLENRRGKVPYDSSRPVHTFWDLGHSDHTAIWFVQRVGMEYNVINYYQDHLKKIGFYLEQLQSFSYVYGKHYLPHDADNETLASRSIAKIVRDKYPSSVIIVPRVPKKVLGIQAARTIFDLCNFDEERTSDGWQCLCRYCYSVDEDGKFSREPEHNEYSHGCFTADTKILTREGEKCISTLPENGEVLTLCGWKKYQNPRITRVNAQLVEVTFSDGNTVKCTPDHLFLTVENEWKSAENLLPGLSIQSGLVQQNNFLMTGFIEYINQVNILQVLKSYIVMFGNMLLVQFQKIVTFIIEMKIKQIISCGIWNVFQQRNICLIPLFVNGKMDDLVGLVKKRELKLQNGINQKKVVNGINNTLLKHGSEKQNNAYFVIKNLKHYLNRSIVHLSVGNKITNNKEQMNQKSNILLQKIEFAKNVGNLLFKNLNVVEIIESFVQKNVGQLTIKSVKKLNEIADVWCLTVPDVGHFSLANGAIVKNCDAFQTFALSLKTETASKKPKKKEVSKVIHLGSPNNWMGG